MVGEGIPDALQVRFRLEPSTKVSFCIDWMDDGTAIKQKLHGVPGINVERVRLYSFYCRFLVNWFLCTNCTCHISPAPRYKNAAWLTLEGRKEWVMNERTTIYINMWRTISSDVSIQRRHCQPLSVHLWAYCTHPTHDVNDVMCEGWPQHRGLRPLLFSNSGVGSFTSHKNQISESAVRRDLERITLHRCHYKGSTLFSVI